MFAYVSLNGNGYGFDQNFDILTFGDSSDGNACGYWGCGTSYKQMVTVNGKTEYQLLGTGEPHGTLQFKGTFDTVNWRSLSDENWNGFTVGVQGTAVEFCDANPTAPGCTRCITPCAAGANTTWWWWCMASPWVTRRAGRTRPTGPTCWPHSARYTPIWLAWSMPCLSGSCGR